jgi:hypothetical protein
LPASSQHPSGPRGPLLLAGKEIVSADWREFLARKQLVSGLVVLCLAGKEKKSSGDLSCLPAGKQVLGGRESLAGKQTESSGDLPRLAGKESSSSGRSACRKLG